MICSCLIPSRQRPDKLALAIASIQMTSHPEDVEILVRFDDDDTASLSIIPDLEAKGVRVLVGPRYEGYRSHGRFYTELSKIANGAWIAGFNDDTMIQGQGWADKLKAVPMDGFIVQPEFSRIGDSTYHRAEGQCVPFVPNLCWEQFGHQEIGIPTDTWLDTMLRQDHGWHTAFLPGVTIWHQWNPEEASGKRN